MPPPTKSRNLVFDLARIAAVFGVIAIHSSTYAIDRLEPADIGGWWSANIYNAMARWAVPIFIMISGAYLLREKIPVMEFYKKRIFKIFIPLVFWSALYTAYKYYCDVTIDKKVLDDFLMGQPYYHLWFIYMITGLYAATPLLRMIAINSEKKMLVIATATIFFITAANGMICFLTDKPIKLSLFVIWTPYIAYFMAGYIVVTRNFAVRTIPMLAIWIAMSILLVLEFTFIRIQWTQRNPFAVYTSFNPLIIVMSLCVFSWLATQKIKVGDTLRGPIQLFSECTLGIYLIHPIILDVVRQYFHFNEFFIHPFIGIPAMSVLTYILALMIIASVREMPILRRVV